MRRSTRPRSRAARRTPRVLGTQSESDRPIEFHVLAGIDDVEARNPEEDSQAEQNRRPAEVAPQGDPTLPVSARLSDSPSQKCGPGW